MMLCSTNHFIIFVSVYARTMYSTLISDSELPQRLHTCLQALVKAANGLINILIRSTDDSSEF